MSAAEDRRPFGNLSFSEYTMETSVERLLLALKASMVVHGHQPKSKPMVVLGRLQKALKRTKKYSFSLLPVRMEDNKQNEDVVEDPPEDPLDSMVASELARLLSMKVVRKSVCCTGRTVTLTAFLVGPAAAVSTPSRAQHRIASSLRKSPGVGPVFVQPLNVQRKKSVCAVKAVVVYKVV